MKEPALPPNEAQRLQRLHALNLLDSLREDRFDRFTRLASRFLDAPIAAISLIDVDRQWFKSEVGLGVCETPRRLSFCAHAILGSGAFYVPDTHADPRFADNPLVTGAPHLRFYAGVPLHLPDGIALGALCVMDRRPRELGMAELETLRDLANALQREFAVHALLQEVDEIDDSQRPVLAALRARPE